MLSFFKSDKSDKKADESQEQPLGWAARLKQGLSKTRNNLGRQLTGLFGGGKIDEALYEELETVLLSADVGVAATQYLLDDLRSRVKRDKLEDAAQLKQALRDGLQALLTPLEAP